MQKKYRLRVGAYATHYTFCSSP